MTRLHGIVRRPFLLKAHRNLGILVALPFLLSIVTGIVLALPGWIDSRLEPMRRTQAYSDAMVVGIVRIDATVLPTLERAFNAAYPLHTGRLNLLYRLLLTASGLGLVLVSVFGLLGFSKRFRKSA
jgi:uncharacterized iron-regulated membrane protein